MLISINGRKILDDSTSLDALRRRVQFALGRFAHRVRRVQVFLEDLNGPRGGVDKACRMVARLTSSRDVVVEGHDSEFESLIDRTANRLGRSVARELERNRREVDSFDL